MSPENEDKTLVQLVEEMVDKGATTAEEIHRAIADMPLEVLERLDLLGQTTSEVRRIQDTSIGAVYDMIRDVTHKVSKLADEALERSRAEAP